LCSPRPQVGQRGSTPPSVLGAAPASAALQRYRATHAALLLARDDLTAPGSRRSRTARVFKERMGWAQVTEDQERAFSCVATRFKSAILNLACGEGKLAIGIRSAQSFCTGMLLVAPTHALVASHLRQIGAMGGISGHRLLTPGGDVSGHHSGSAAGWDAQTRAAIAALQGCTTHSPTFVVIVCTPEALTHPVTRGVLAGCAQKRDCGLGVVAFDEHHVVFQWWQIRSDALAKAAGVVADVWDAARQQDPTGGAMRPLITVMSSTLTDRDVAAIPAMCGMHSHETIRSSMVRDHVTLTLARLSAGGKAVHRYVADLVLKRGRNGPGTIVYVPSATGAVTMATAIQALLESIGGTHTAENVIAVTGKQNRDGAATLLAQFAAGKVRVAVVTEIWAQGISVPAVDLVITQPCRGLELSAGVVSSLTHHLLSLFFVPRGPSQMGVSKQSQKNLSKPLDFFEIDPLFLPGLRA